MTTDNHTPIQTGAAANASTFNNPLGQLDYALGDLDVLTTTVKTTLVGALNELNSTKAAADTSQTANLVKASPNGSSGIPGYRALVNADLPTSTVGAGTYTKLTVNAQGIVTAGASIGTADISNLSTYPTDTLGPLTDVTTNNASATKHGFLPKLSNSGTEVLTGLGTWVKWGLGVKYNGSVAFTARSYIDFRGTGLTVIDDSGNDAIRVTVTGGTGTGATQLNELSDVTLTTPSIGQALVYDGTDWKNTSLASGHIIQEEGSNLTARLNLNFIGSAVTVSDDAGNNATKVTIDVPVKASGSDINTGTDDAKFATAKAIADSNLVFSGDLPVKASGAEVIGGSDDAKFVTAKALKDAGVTNTKLISLVPHKQLYIQNASPKLTNGCAPTTQIEMGTNKNVYDYLAFDPSAIEYAYANIVLPQDYTGGTVYAQFFWTHPATTVNFTSIFGLSGICITDDETLDVAQGTPQYVSDVGGTTNDLYASALSSAITISGTPAAGKLCQLEISRKATDGGDTLAVDAYLLGVMLYYPVASV